MYDRGLISFFISPVLFIVETMLSPLNILASLSNISWLFISCVIFPWIFIFLGGFCYWFHISSGHFLYEEISFGIPARDSETFSGLLWICLLYSPCSFLWQNSFTDKKHFVLHKPECFLLLGHARKSRTVFPVIVTILNPDVWYHYFHFIPVHRLF